MSHLSQDELSKGKILKTERLVYLVFRSNRRVGRDGSNVRLFMGDLKKGSNMDQRVS